VVMGRRCDCGLSMARSGNGRHLLGCLPPRRVASDFEAFFFLSSLCVACVMGMKQKGHNKIWKARGGSGTPSKHLCARRVDKCEVSVFRWSGVCGPLTTFGEVVFVERQATIQTTRQDKRSKGKMCNKANQMGLLTSYL
jgi:hypothetical protein